MTQALYARHLAIKCYMQLNSLGQRGKLLPSLQLSGSGQSWRPILTLLQLFALWSTCIIVAGLLTSRLVLR